MKDGWKVGRKKRETNRRILFLELIGLSSLFDGFEDLLLEE